MTFHALSYPFTISIKPSALYNTIEYLQDYNVDDVYRLVMTENNIVMGQVNLYLRNDEAINAPYSGFGGIEHCLPSVMLRDFVNKIIAWCTDKGLRRLRLKLPSPVYSGNLALTEKILLEKGFAIISNDVNQHIPVSEVKYTAIIRKNEQKRLRKCRDAGFEFRKMDAGELRMAYALISDNRVRRGFPMTMTFEALESMYLKFPEKYLLFGVFDGDQLVATSVSIRVTDDVLYNFYHGDAAGHRHFSPVVMVIQGIYNFCQQHNINILDLGISSVNGALNAGLYRFKENCGCIYSSKKIVEKVIK